jgi:hypothetical protein
MALYYRRDDEVQNGLGQAMPNIAVTYYVQPGLTLATVYEDPAGLTPATNPQYTNGLGQTAAYMASGTYTITYSGAQIQTLTYPDQVITPPGSGLTKISVSPSADGTTRIFTLASAPTDAPNDQLFVAGSLVPYSASYTVSGTTLTWIAAVPPQTGDNIEYFAS